MLVVFCYLSFESLPSPLTRREKTSSSEAGTPPFLYTWVLNCTERYIPEAVPVTVVKSLLLEVFTVLFKKDSFVINIMYTQKIRQ